MWHTCLWGTCRSCTSPFLGNVQQAMQRWHCGGGIRAVTIRWWQRGDGGVRAHLVQVELCCPGGDHSDLGPLLEMTKETEVLKTRKQKLQTTMITLYSYHYQPCYYQGDLGPLLKTTQENRQDDTVEHMFLLCALTHNPPRTPSHAPRGWGLSVRGRCLVREQYTTIHMLLNLNHRSGASPWGAGAWYSHTRHKRRTRDEEDR